MLTHRIILSLFAASCVAVPSLLACGSSETGSSNAPNATAPAAGNSEESHEGKFTRNVVVFNEDGTQTVHFSWITRAEQLEEQAQRKAQAAGGVHPLVDTLTNDNCSFMADVLLFDQQNEEGDEICFRNTHGSPAVANLASSSYVRYYQPCGVDTIYEELWYGPVVVNDTTCAVGSSSNRVESIEGASNTPGGCFNESGTNFAYDSSAFWNFDVHNSGQMNTGSSITSYQYLWLSNDDPDGSVDNLCYNTGG
jgi:hypothetical protein